MKEQKKEVGNILGKLDFGTIQHTTWQTWNHANSQMVQSPSSLLPINCMHTISRHKSTISSHNPCKLSQRNIKIFMKFWFHNLNSKTFATLANLKQVIPQWLNCANHKCNMRIIMHIIVLVTSRWPYVLMLANWVA